MMTRRRGGGDDDDYIDGSEEDNEEEDYNDGDGDDDVEEEEGGYNPYSITISFPCQPNSYKAIAAKLHVTREPCCLGIRKSCCLECI